MENATDILGHEFQLGDVVAYATRSGNSGALRIGHIDKIYKRAKKYYPSEQEWVIGIKTPNDTFAKLTNLKNIIIITNGTETRLVELLGI